MKGLGKRGAWTIAAALFACPSFAAQSPRVVRAESPVTWRGIVGTWRLDVKLPLMKALGVQTQPQVDAFVRIMELTLLNPAYFADNQPNIGQQVRVIRAEARKYAQAFARNSAAADAVPMEADTKRVLDLLAGSAEEEAAAWDGKDDGLAMPPAVPIYRGDAVKTPRRKRPAGRPADGIRLVRKVRVKFAPNNQMIATKRDIAKFVEQPWLKAAEVLWDKNIRTKSSSANAKNLADGIGYLSLDYDSMSPKNRQIAEQLGLGVDEHRGHKSVSLKIKITPTTTVAEFNGKALELAGAFEAQPLTWVDTYTFKQVKKAYGAKSPRDVRGLYYVSSERLFYPSRELYLKIKAQESRAGN